MKTMRLSDSAQPLVLIEETVPQPQPRQGELLVRADTSDVDAGKAAVATTVQRFGRWDILVNNANAFAQRPLENMETRILECSGFSTANVNHIKEEKGERAPPGRRETSEEGAAWSVDLASHTANWMTGQVIAIDGGLSLAEVPRVTNRSTGWAWLVRRPESAPWRLGQQTKGQVCCGRN